MNSSVVGGGGGRLTPPPQQVVAGSKIGGSERVERAEFKSTIGGVSGGERAVSPSEVKGTSSSVSSQDGAMLRSGASTVKDFEVEISLTFKRFEVLTAKPRVSGEGKAAWLVPVNEFTMSERTQMGIGGTEHNSKFVTLQNISGAMATGAVLEFPVRSSTLEELLTAPQPAPLQSGAASAD